MEIENEIVCALKAQSPKFATIDPQQLEPIQENTYYLKARHPYFLKWVSDDDGYGQNEIRVNQTLLKKSNAPAPKLVLTARLSTGSIACWEWLEGTDLRCQHRQKLQDAFYQIGKFHAENRHSQAVYSLVTKQPYDTARELLSNELNYLCRHHEVSILRKAKNVFALLETGYSTYIHGDFHPGNIRLIGEDIQIVDWGYCMSSLCLFELGYVETIPFGEENEHEWWRITPDEAQEILPAYYNAAGLVGNDSYEIHLAVMLWAKLWSYSNCVRNQNQIEGEKCKRHIELLLK
jgi:thiamine kinase-like enzyme